MANQSTLAGKEAAWVCGQRGHTGWTALPNMKQAGFVICGNEKSKKVFIFLFINVPLQIILCIFTHLILRVCCCRPRLHYWIIMDRISLQLPCLTTSDLTSWFLTHCLDRLLLLQVLLGFLLLREFLVSGNTFFFVVVNVRIGRICSWKEGGWGLPGGVCVASNKKMKWC